MSETIYVFVGEGLGVPGLPHRITTAEAESLGAGKLLADAIANGNYRAETSPSPPAHLPPSGGLPAGEASSGSIDLADGASDEEARLAGQTLASRRKPKS